MGKKNLIHKEVWSRLCGEVAPILQSWGFQEHPLWPDAGWDPHNRDYTFYLMHKDVCEGLLEAECRYAPHSRQIDLKITRYPNSWGFKNISEFDVSTDDWVKRGLNDQWEEWQLQRASFRNIFRRSYFKIKFKRDAPEQNNVESEMQLLLARLPHLQRAVFSGAKSRFVDKDSREAHQREERRTKFFGKSWNEWLSDTIGVFVTFGAMGALFGGIIWVMVLLGVLK